MPVGLVDFILILSCAFTFLGYRNNPLLPHTNPHILKVFSADGQLGLAWVTCDLSGVYDSGILERVCRHSRPQSPSLLGHVVGKRG